MRAPRRFSQSACGSLRPRGRESTAMAQQAWRCAREVCVRHPLRGVRTVSLGGEEVLGRDALLGRGEDLVDELLVSLQLAKLELADSVRRLVQQRDCLGVRANLRALARSVEGEPCVWFARTPFRSRRQQRTSCSLTLNSTCPGLMPAARHMLFSLIATMITPEPSSVLPIVKPRSPIFLSTVTCERSN